MHVNRRTGRDRIGEKYNYAQKIQYLRERLQKGRREREGFKILPDFAH